MKLVSVGRQFAKVDDADFELVSQFKWHLTKGASNRTYYARATGAGPHATRPVFYMHRLIMGLIKAPRTVHVDHRNGDTLDNQRHNLRIANPVQNGANRVGQKTKSGFKGVFADGLKWRARIGHGPGSSKGRYNTPEEAARAYDIAAREKYGAFARLNFPLPGEASCVVHAQPAPFNRQEHINNYRKYARELGRKRRALKGAKSRPRQWAATDKRAGAG